MSAYLELSNVNKAFPTKSGSATIVKDLNLRVEKGQFVSIIGHSGCGKSTVLSMLAGLTPLTGGGIVLAGKEVTEAGPDRGIVFQSPCLLPWMTAYENVRLGVDQVFYTAHPDERHQIVEYYLSVVGLGDSMHVRPGELSQGMQQRVGIARAFALSPKILLLDEPFGMLDSLTRIELQDVLMEVWKRKKITAVMVTHDVDESIFLSDRVVLMTNGPEAHVGRIVDVPFERPRVREKLLKASEFLAIKDQLLDFLEGNHPSNPSTGKDSPGGHKIFSKAVKPAVVNSDLAVPKIAYQAA